MARHNQKDGHPKSRYDLLQDQARGLAEEFGIPYDRLLCCLTRFSEAWAAREEGDEDHLIRRAARLVRDVISALGEEQGINFLEQVSPFALERRIRAMELLCGHAVPFYTLDELRHQLREFLDFEKEIESFLIETGLPPRMLKRSPWLFLHLGRLYDTRCTSSPYPRDPNLPSYRKGKGPLEPEPKQIAASDRPTNPPYTWVRHSSNCVLTPDQIEHCECADADLLPGMSPDDAERLEAERPRFLAARTAVIEELVRSCEECDGGQLLERCLAILDAKLGRETVLFLLRMDAFYLGGDARSRNQVELTPRMSPGGLTNLIEVVGHVENELCTGHIDRLKRSVPKNAIEFVATGDDGTEVYLEATQRPDSDALNAALDEFSERGDTSRRRWTEFSRRFAGWLDPDCRVALRVDARSEYAERLIPLVREFISYQESRADAEEPLVAVPPTETKNEFRFDGSSWVISFDGKTRLVKDLDGYFYIAELLKERDCFIKPIELRRRVRNWKTSSIKLSKNGPSKALSRLQKDAGEAATEEALLACQFRLVEVKEELATAEADGKGAAAAELREERDQLITYLKANTDHRGKPRPISSEPKKAADAVRNAITRAIDDLEEKHQTLYEHLDRWLETGSTCRYSPQMPVDWDVQA